MRRIRRSFGWRVVLGGVVLLLLAASCGDDSGSEAGSEGGSTESGSTESGSTTSSEFEPVVGGDVTLALSTEVATLDPVSAVGSTSDAQRMFALYGALIAYRQDAAEIDPVIAESMEPSADFKTWTIKLRPDVTFSDGSPYDAAAVLAHFERIQEPANASPAMSVAAAIESATVVDPSTLELVLAEPNAVFPASLSYSAMNYVPSAQAREDGVDLTSTPVGAGPFILKEWERDDHMTLERNPNYFDAPRPYLDTITFRTIPGDAQRVDTFLTGGVNMVYTQVPQEIQRAMGEQDGLETAGSIQVSGRTLSFNVTKAPLDDVRVRRAVALAVDRQVVADVSNPGATAAENLSGSDPDSIWFSEEGALPPLDVDEAQRLIDEYVGETGGPVEFAIESSQSPFISQAAKTIQTSMNQLNNVSVDVSIADGPTFQGKVLRGEYQAAVWGIPWVDPDVLYASMTTGSSRNVSRYSNPAVDAALEEARLTDEVAARLEQYEIVFESFVKDLPFLPLFDSENFYLHDQSLHDVAPSLYDVGNLRSDLMWIDAQ